MSEINLLHKKQQTDHFGKFLPYLRIVSIVCLIVTTTASLVLFLMKVDSPLVLLKKQEKTAIQNITVYNQQLAKDVVIKDRAQAISQLLSSRSEVPSIVGYIADGVPLGVYVNSLSVNKTETSITVVSQSLVLLQTFVDNMAKIVTEKKVYKTVRLNDFALDQKAKLYAVTIQFH